jgi:hypothetical protein
MLLIFIITAIFLSLILFDEDNNNKKDVGCHNLIAK